MFEFVKKTTCELDGLKDKPVIIPIGSIEQHGPHLPLETDSLLVERIAEVVGEKTDCIILPTIRFGVSEEHMDFTGTITLTPESFKGMIYDICKSLKKHGFNRQHIINYHGGNKKYVLELIPRIEKEDISVRLHRVLGRLNKFDHAGELETSLMLYCFPELVRKNQIKRFDYKIPAVSGWKTKDYAAEGVIGDAIDATAEKGKEYFNIIVEEIIEEIKNG